MRLIGIGEVSIQGRAVKRDHDDLATVAVVAFFFLFGNVDHRQSDRRHMAVLDQNAGALEFVPMIHSAVAVSDEICARFIGKPLKFPAGDSVSGNKMVCAPVHPSC